jgi:N-acetyl-gamma-glutamyl-phosphate reductase
MYPALSGSVDLAFEPYEPEACKDADIVFLALPSGEASHCVPQLIGSVPRIIDLSGDSRLQDALVYESYYKHPHGSPELLAEAVYGLPELNAGSIAHARLVANPGCYPTGAILALLPALKRGVIRPDGIVINSLSGVSGAGRSSSVELSFSEVNENIRAYKIGIHQHLPEIRGVLTSVAGKPVPASFVPHLVPLTRGIYTTIHAELDGSYTEAELFDFYETAYGQAPFVRLRRHVPEIRHVTGTNFCDIHLSVEKGTRRVVIVSVIDNLIKGAAGQALQNMNIMFGLPEQQGLL